METISEMAFFRAVTAWREEQTRTRYVRPSVAPNLAREAERRVAARLEAMGYAAWPMGHNCRHDLEIDQGCRVEVKAATWRDIGDRRGGRYQFHFHNRADLLILCAINGSWHFYVLPVEALAGRRNVSVWCYEPERSSGWLRPYLEAWTLVSEIVNAERTYQLPLF